MRGILEAVFAVLIVIGGVSSAAPQPAVVPAATDWTIDVRFEHLQQIELQLSGDKPARFWYTILTLTNNTHSDADFYPKCELMTDTFQIIPAGEQTPPAVFERIKNRHHSRYPFLEPLEKASNKLLQGEDNSKDLVVIWPDFDARAGSVKLFIAGLSNETTVIDHPTAKDKEGRPVKVYLRKTLELNYKIAGDPAFRSEVKPAYEGKRWVMR
jgi:hypothetical protein